MEKAIRLYKTGGNFADTEINQRYDLRDAIRAHEDIEQRRTVGSSIFVI